MPDVEAMQRALLVWKVIAALMPPKKPEPLMRGVNMCQPLSLLVSLASPDG